MPAALKKVALGIFYSFHGHCQLVVFNCCVVNRGLRYWRFEGQNLALTYSFKLHLTGHQTMTQLSLEYSIKIFIVFL